MKFVAIGGVILLFGLGSFLFFYPRVLTIAPMPTGGEGHTASAQTADALPSIPESTSSGATPSLASSGAGRNSNDIEKQGKLPNPPQIVKGIYVTGWTAGSDRKIDSLIAFMKRAGLNAMVIDIKDYSGYVSYHTDLPEVKASGAEGEIRISHPNTLIKKLHDNGIYIIARESVFQDPILATAHPEWAFLDTETGKPWKDAKGLSWMNPASQGAWDYVVWIARDASARGFDEINFDYIRFPSDGNLNTIAESAAETAISESETIAQFFKYLREHLPHTVISADLFGLATVASNDLGIGQLLENAYLYFDYVSPMVYPSHYGAGFLGYKNPALHPYEVIKYSMDKALEKRFALEKNNSSSSRPLAQVRPWLQVFDLGATYDAAMVQKEMNAARDSFLNATGTAGSAGNAAHFTGWLLWDPGNTYTAIKALSS